MSDRPYYIPYAMISTGVLAAMTPSAAKVLLALAAHDGPDGIYPTRPTLAAECDFDLRTLDAATELLELLRLAEVIRSRRGNRYRLLPPSVVASNVATTSVATPNVATSNAPSVGTTDVATVGTSNAPQTLSKSTKQEHQAPRAAGASQPSGASSSLIGTNESEASTAAEDSPSVTKTAPKGKPKAKRMHLTDADKMRICEAPSAMFEYLTQSCRWYPEGGSMKDIVPDASTPQLAGLWWACVTQARAAAGVPLTVPDLPRIIGSVKTLQKTMTQEQLVELMRTVAKHWAAIRASLAWMGSPPELDEATLSYRHVREAAARLMRDESLTVTRTESKPAATLTPNQQALVDAINERMKHQPVL